ncbi:hypothetical protein DEIPH_ctg032orf0116 [Deinococcus phoenicis]|uniref:DUF262 domain-containing protein n=1 Tax=Deinococcus phoenicis TaxID=1476583 RepID=A0A016QPD4_9DEIO|nr:hypothetical protein DEIPH_ctg032orf0116 [Deinococcus phoenicis]
MSLFRVLQGSSGRQYEVPIYQRTYSWQREQVERLWDDVLEAGAQGRPHFTGSVVYVTTSDDDMADVTQALLIDGQQRLTTTTLFLIALVRRLKVTGGFKVEKDGSTVNVSAESIRKNLLVNPDVSGRLHHKLVLTKSDRETLARLLDSLEDEHTPLPPKPSPRLLDTLAFFEAQLGKPGVDLAQVYAGLQRLQVVRIALKDGEDDPQLIFDSMNSTGLDLSEADRIRNYVLMRMGGKKQEKQQEKLYHEHWFQMERLFDGTEPGAFDRFIRDFLSLRSKTPIPARLGDVYVAFKRYVERDLEKDQQDIPFLVRELHRAAGYYAALLDPQKHEADAEVRRALLSLRGLELDVWYPLVLDAYSAWKAGDLYREEFVELLGTLESYLYRRWVCGVGTQGLNKFFPALPGQLRGQPYLQAFKDQLYGQRSYLRFPSDEDFRQQIMIRPMYTPRHLSRYTLGHLENHEDKEPINPGDYTIEHVMPQNKALATEWREMLGEHWAEVQERYLHTLGNLTLTGYNPEYSDRPFLEKRDLLKGKGKGFKSSHLLLNQELAELDEWNEGRIRERAERLADRALKVWPMVQPSEELREQLSQRVAPGVHALEDHLLGLPPALRVLVDDLRTELLDLHPKVQEVPTKKYIAFKVGTNFCDLVPQPELGSVKCWLNIPFADLDDPHGLARDVTEVGHHGNGDAEVVVRPETPLDAFLELAQQALNYQLNRSVSGSSSPSSLSSLAASLEQLAWVAREALETFESRLVEIDPSLTRTVTQSYMGYGRPVELVVLLRSGAALVEVQPRDPDILLPALFEGWEPRSKDRWAFPLRTAEDAERALPLVRAVHEQFQQGIAYREPQVRQLVQALRAAFTAQGVGVKSSKAADYFMLDERDLARLWINREGVYLALRHPYGELENPQGLGEAQVGQPLSGWEPGYFNGRFSHPDEVSALDPLLRQAVEAHRASVL